jgi:hypothetical protein
MTFIKSAESVLMSKRLTRWHWIVAARAATQQTFRWLGVIVSGTAVLFAILSYGGFCVGAFLALPDPAKR